MAEYNAVREEAKVAIMEQITRKTQGATAAQLRDLAEAYGLMVGTVTSASGKA
jgi:hypothetical protein